MTTGTLLDGIYELKEELGRGASGTVYRAFNRRIQQDVAIKLLIDGNQLIAHRDRLRREFQALYQLAGECAHLVRVLDFNDGTRDSCPQPFLVMECLSGETLQSALIRATKTNTPLTIPLICDVVYQAGTALQVAHSKGILHRDIKPENIFLTRGGSQPVFVKVLDFGLAKTLGEDPTKQSMPNMFVGTPAYASPEAARAFPLNEQSDIYSLGCVTYELLTGYPPFGARDAYALLDQQVFDAPVHVAEKRPDCPPYLAELVMAMLRKRPSDRPQGLSVILETLTRISHHPPATTAKPRASSGRAPSAVLSGLKARLRASPVRAPRIHGHFGGLAAKSGEKSGLRTKQWAHNDDETDTPTVVVTRRTASLDLTLDENLPSTRSLKQSDKNTVAEQDGLEDTIRLGRIGSPQPTQTYESINITLPNPPIDSVATGPHAEVQTTNPVPSTGRRVTITAPKPGQLIRTWAQPLPQRQPTLATPVIDDPDDVPHQDEVTWFQQQHQGRGWTALLGLFLIIGAAIVWITAFQSPPTPKTEHAVVNGPSTQSVWTPWGTVNETSEKLNPVDTPTPNPSPEPHNQFETQPEQDQETPVAEPTPVDIVDNTTADKPTVVITPTLTETNSETATTTPQPQKRRATTESNKPKRSKESKRTSPKGVNAPAPDDTPISRPPNCQSWYDMIAAKATTGNCPSARLIHERGRADCSRTNYKPMADTVINEHCRR